MSLNDLFMQILESEQKARERKGLLNELKSKISGVRQQLQATQTEANTLHADLAAKLQELCTEELECQWICVKEAILKEQLEELTKEKQSYNEQLQHIKSKCDKMKEDFQSNISAFIHDFGLTSRGKEERLVSVKEQVKEMKVRQKELQEDIDICNKQRDMLRCIEDEKTATENLIATLKSEIRDMEDALMSEKVKAKQLEDEKALVSGKPHSDPEFKRLQTQLDACRNESLEGLCQTLRQQIDQLQRQQWQQQLRRQHPSSGGRPQPRFKWTVQPSVSRVPPTSSSWSNSYPSSSPQCPPRKTPVITTPEMGIKTTTSSSSSSSSSFTKPSVSSSSCKPNLAKLTTALKCKEENQ